MPKYYLLDKVFFIIYTDGVINNLREVVGENFVELIIVELYVNL